MKKLISALTLISVPGFAHISDSGEYSGYYSGDNFGPANMRRSLAGVGDEGASDGEQQSVFAQGLGQPPAAELANVPAPASPPTQPIDEGTAPPLASMVPPPVQPTDEEGSFPPPASTASSVSVAESGVDMRELELRLTQLKIREGELQIALAQDRTADAQDIQGELEETRTRRTRLEQSRDNRDWSAVLEELRKPLQKAMKRLNKHARNEGGKFLEKMTSALGLNKSSFKRKKKKKKKREEAQSQPGRPLPDLLMYLSANPDLEAVIVGKEGRAVEGALAQHWRSHGYKERHRLLEVDTSNFDHEAYANAYHDVFSVYGYNKESLVQHYKQHGAREIRRGLRPPLPQ